MLVPIEQERISQFVPLPVDTLFQSLQQNQRRQDQVLGEIDAIQEFADKFQVLEQDRELFNEETNAIRNQINQIADVGFVGDRGRQVRGLSRKFRSAVAPFQQSQENFLSSREAIESDDSLNRAQKDSRLALLQSGLGLRRDEKSGQIDRSSVFQGREFASAVDLNKLAVDALKGTIASRGVDITQLSDSQLALVASEFIPQNKIEEIARNSILGNPEAMAFIQDEVELADFRKQQTTGESLTSDERAILLEQALARPIRSAISKFGGVQKDVEIRNIPGAGLGKKSAKDTDVGIPFSGGNVPVIKETHADLTARQINLEARREGIIAKMNDGSVASEIQKSAFTAELNQIAIEEENIAEDLNKALRRNEIKRSDFERVNASRPDRPANIDSKIAERLERAANDPGLLGFSSLANSVVEAPGEREYKIALRDWIHISTPEEKALIRAVDGSLANIQAERASELLQARTFPKGSNIPDNIDTILQGTGLDSGIEILDEKFQSVDAINIEDVKIAGYTLSPDAEGFYYIKAADPKTGESYNIKLDSITASSIGRQLQSDIGDNITNADALEVFTAAQNMQGIGVANQLENMDTDTKLSLISNDPNLLKFGDDQLFVYKAPNGYIAIVDEEGEPVEDEETGEPIVFQNGQDANLSFFLPRMQKLAEDGS